MASLLSLHLKIIIIIIIIIINNNEFHRDTSLNKTSGKLKNRRRITEEGGKDEW